MAISKWLGWVAGLLERDMVFSEALLDGWIEDALREEALAQPPGTTWERLRQMLEGRRKRRYGMWVLDEPLHDPPRALSSGMPVLCPKRHPWERYRSVQPYTAESVVAHLNFALAAFINY